jgi:NitT/TauT family transport system substrate-binding protein
MQSAGTTHLTLSRRRLLTATALIAGGSLVAACAPTPVAAPATSKPAAASVATSGPAKLSPPVTIKYGNVEAASAAPLYIGLDRGYFADMGLDVEPQTFTTAADMVPVLANGQLDAGKGTISAGLFNAMLRGISIKIVADAGSNLSGFVYTTLALRKGFADHFTGWADLKGRKVASTGIENAGVYRIDKLMRTVGLTYKDVDIVGLGSAEQIAAMSSGVLDAGTLIEPFLTKALEDGTAALAPGGRDLSVGDQSAVVVFGPSLQTKAEAAKRFMYAYLRGVRDYNKAFKEGVDKEAVIQLLIKNTSIKDRALYDHMGMPGLDVNGRVLKDDLDGLQKWFVETGIMAQPLSMDNVIDYQYADYAVGLLGSA